MKAAVYTKYGPPEVVSIEDVPSPKPKATEVLVKVHYAGVTFGDARLRSANFPRGFALLGRLGLGIFAPWRKILGTGFSGTVEEIGDQVKNFKVGDEVLGMMGMKSSAHAEYLTRDSSNSIVHKPKELSFAQAAALMFGGTSALYFVRDCGNVKSGQHVLINGASGSVGNFAVQLAKHYGATVTGVCSTANIAFVKSLGADEVIDYTKDDIFQLQKSYDVVIDLTGNITIKNGFDLLTKKGTLVLGVAGLGEQSLIGAGLVKKDSKTVKAGVATEKAKDMTFLAELVVNGELQVRIDQEFAFKDIVNAYHHIESRKKQGSVVVKIA